MTAVQNPPIYEPLSREPSMIASLPWILFFNQIFNGDTGESWTPVFTNLTVVGAAPTITGRMYRIGRSLAYFRIKVVPGTDTSSTAGTTYVTGFPLTFNGDGACIAVSGLLGSTPGMVDQASQRIYVPTWTNVTVPLSIVGFVEAS